MVVLWNVELQGNHSVSCTDVCDMCMYMYSQREVASLSIDWGVSVRGRRPTFSVICMGLKERVRHTMNRKGMGFYV